MLTRLMHFRTPFFEIRPFLRAKKLSLAPGVSFMRAILVSETCLHVDFSFQRESTERSAFDSRKSPRIFLRSPL